MATIPPKIPKDIDDELSPKARKFFTELIDGYERRIAELLKRIEVLEAQLQKLTPQNSSLPPSTQHPHAKPPAKQRKPSPGTKPKKQGAQPGHARNTRPLVPTEDCDQIHVLRPKRCRKCNYELFGSDPNPIRHQVIDIPIPKPTVTEYQQHRLTCKCGVATCAPLPTGVPSGQCGPRLAAFCGLLMGHFRQSKRRTANFLQDVLNIPCSAGWTVKIQNLVSDALAEPYQQLRRELENQEQLFVDESPTKQKQSKAWLWVAVAPLFAVFGIFLTRKREALVALVGDYSGLILNCDRAKMYFDGQRLQWCWAHLKRDIQKLIDNADNQVKRLGHDLMRQQRLLFELWRSYRASQLDWPTFQNQVQPIRQEFDALVQRGVFSGNSRLIGMCEELYKHRQWLWTFTEVQGIEPTNNAAERALRPAVIYRKLSFGTQSDAGSRYLERILTVSETCRLQNRSPFLYLVELMEAKFNHQPAPSLLPNNYNTQSKAA